MFEVIKVASVFIYRYKNTRQSSNEEIKIKKKKKNRDRCSNCDHQSGSGNFLLPSLISRCTKQRNIKFIPKIGSPHYNDRGWLSTTAISDYQLRAKGHKLLPVRIV